MSNFELKFIFSEQNVSHQTSLGTLLKQFGIAVGEVKPCQTSVGKEQFVATFPDDASAKKFIDAIDLYAGTVEHNKIARYVGCVKGAAIVRNESSDIYHLIHQDKSDRASINFIPSEPMRQLLHTAFRVSTEPEAEEQVPKVKRKVYHAPTREFGIPMLRRRRW